MCVRVCVCMCCIVYVCNLLNRCCWLLQHVILSKFYDLNVECVNLYSFQNVKFLLITKKQFA